MSNPTLLDLAARFIALSITYREHLIPRWPDPVTDEWLAALRALETKLSSQEGECQKDTETLE